MKKILLLSIIIFLCIIFSAITISETSSPDLKTAIQKKDAKMIKQAVNNLVQQNNEKALNTLTGELTSLGPTPESAAYWEILGGISRFTNKDVISKVANLIITNKNKALGSDLLAAMKANRTSTVVPLLSSLLEKGSYEMQLECIHQLGAIPTKETLEALFNFLSPLSDDDTKDPIKGPLIKEVIYSIKNITGVDKGNYPKSWVQWWDENKNKDVSELIHPKKVIDNIEHVGQYRDMKGIETLDKEKVLVLRNDKCDKNTAIPGNYDKIEDILSRLNLPHTVIGKSEFDVESYSLDDKWALVINCNQFREHCCNPEHYKLKPVAGKGGVRLGICPGKDNHQNHDTKLSEKAIKKITQFVETGGYLFTEDLGIEEVIERAFKGYIVHTKYLPDQQVKIMPAPGAALHYYLKYVFEAPPSNTNQNTSEGKSSETTSIKQQEFRIDAEWKVDNESPDIRILKKDGSVTILIVSPQLAKQNKNEGAVAVTWSYGKAFTPTGSNKPTYIGGRVLHVMSHFGKQRSKLDEFALQNLILNFFMELNEQRPKAKKK